MEDFGNGMKGEERQGNHSGDGVAVALSLFWGGGVGWDFVDVWTCGRVCAAVACFDFESWFVLY